MKVTFFKRVVVALACVGMLSSNAVLAGAPVAQPAAVQVQVSDVALRAGGVLVGQVVDAQAKPLAGSVVSIRTAGKEIVRTTSDKNGVFAAKGLRGGQYEVVTASGSSAYRLWAEKTAPPTARTAAMVVASDAVVAGQHAGPGPILNFVTQYPFVAAAGIATAIAVPVAVANDDDDAPSS